MINSGRRLDPQPTDTNLLHRAWQRKSMMEQMEGSQIMKDKKYKLLVEQQHQRVLTEVGICRIRASIMSFAHTL